MLNSRRTASKQLENNFIKYIVLKLFNRNDRLQSDLIRIYTRKRIHMFSSTKSNLIISYFFIFFSKIQPATFSPNFKN